MTSVTTDRLNIAADPALGVKAPCRVATTANITLSGLQTIDGVVLVANDRVLVKDQTTASENGIYVANSTAWSRAKDWDGAGDAVAGTMVKIVSGTTNGGSIAELTTTGTITIGTTSVAFAMRTGTLGALSAYFGTLISAATAAALRSLIGLVIGTDVQAWDADLDTWATKTPPSGAAVGTTDSQSLSNKTLTSPIFSGAIGGTGIPFPATQAASSDANTLDDYEEGTWTPTDASGAGLTLSSPVGKYIKVGKKVTAWFGFTLPATADASACAIGGLPFTSDAFTNGNFGGALSQTNMGSLLTVVVFPATTALTLYSLAGTRQTNANISTKFFEGRVEYMASA